MPLPSSGPISLYQVNVELGLAGGASISLNQTNVRTLFGKPSGTISMSDGYGKSAISQITVGGGTSNFGPGTTYNFSTANEYTVSFSRNTSVIIYCWGAAGGNTKRSTARTGGAGGYARGTFTFSAGVTYKVRVGGGGVGGSGGGSGGYSGGGPAAYSTTSEFDAGGGGGYSGVFATSISQNPANSIIVAGGGGGGSGDTAYGGNGGGTSGTAGSNGSPRAGLGGTQTAGGAGGTEGADGGTGTAFMGGTGGNGPNSPGAGGGGGYWGGGGGAENGPGAGGGGSGYLNSGLTGAILSTGTTNSGVSPNPDGNKPGTAGDASTSAGGTGSAGYVRFYAV
jgi:hypothetical protein